MILRGKVVSMALTPFALDQADRGITLGVQADEAYIEIRLTESQYKALREELGLETVFGESVSLSVNR